MKFIRRPDLDKVTRAEIAAQAFLAQGVYGELTRLARAYRVSRFFVYTLLWQFQELFAPPGAGVPGPPRGALLADEIFAGGQPILLTVEPRSLAILKIELAPDREATTWQQHWAELVSAGLLEQVVSDRARGAGERLCLAGADPSPGFVSFAASAGVVWGPLLSAGRGGD